LKHSKKFLFIRNGWGVASTIIMLMVLFPSIFILSGLITPASENWDHIIEFLLLDYVTNSTILVFCSAIFATLIGVLLAWLVTAFDFPFRRTFKIMLMLPLAIPPYIAAYTYNGLLNYTGVIQTFLRNQLDIQVNQQWFDIMNMKGAIFIFALFLFPYVYLITSSFLERQSAAMIESARMLGKGSVEIFFRVVIPLARVAIVGGGSLVALEVLSDYGVVKYFGIETFAVSVFTVWFGMADVDAALKLSGVMMLFVVLILLVEKWLRGRRKYAPSTTKTKPLKRIALTGVKKWLTFSFCFLVFAFSFLIPVLQLLYWLYLSFDRTNVEMLVGAVGNSFLITILAAIPIVIAAIIVANFNRSQSGIWSSLFAKFMSLAYSIPGSVVAIGVITLFVSVESVLTNVFLSGTIFMLMFAYFVRFLAIGYNSIETGFEKMGKKYSEAGRTLGYGRTSTFFKIDLPLIKPAVVAAFILVFIDIMKELPLTLILRPFNYNTLATKTFEYASDEMIHEAAISALLIIGLCFVSILILNRLTNRGNE
jgi:iron(III) transport system permease protein